MKKIITPKKVVRKEVKEVVEELPIIKENVINPIELDLGRADLNAIVGKLNEVISYINK